MRIIAGYHRGRKIESPEGTSTRPMTDRVRQSLFNLLGETIQAAVVLDVFCGSGALGLESLSRGAASCTFVDADPEAIRIVEANCNHLKVSGQVRILTRNVLRPGAWVKPHGAAAYTHVFMDPPYKMSADPAGQEQLAAAARQLVELGAAIPGTLWMLRTQRGVQIPLPWPGFDVFDERSYGSTTLYLMVYHGRKPE
jgi:16S rRNA (guanine966-N2)-methyltransferase